MHICTLFLLLTIFISSPEGAAAVSGITALPGQVDPYQTRTELLMDASNYTGVSTAEEAASVWAEGLKHRNAAMQYTVMTNRLKPEYAAQLDALGSNWVTGMSSPWIDAFTILSIHQSDEAHAEVALQFEAISSYGPPEYYDATLWLIREDSFWRIDGLRTDEGLYPYTLFQT